MTQMTNASFHASCTWSILLLPILLPVLDVVLDFVHCSYQIAGHMLLSPYQNEDQSHFRILIGVNASHGRGKVKFGLEY